MFGVPLSILQIQNLTYLYDSIANILYYYIKSYSRTLEKENALACIFLRYNLNSLLEFEDIDECNKLKDREDKIIKNIKDNESFISYNVLHDTFSLS